MKENKNIILQDGFTPTSTFQPNERGLRPKPTTPPPKKPSEKQKKK